MTTQALYTTTCEVCEKIALLAIEVGKSFAAFGDSLSRGITAHRYAEAGNYKAAQKVMLDD